MTKNTHLFILFLFSFTAIFSQNDTIVSYLNKSKSQFVEKEEAHFVRKIIQENKNYHVLHYNALGNLVSDEWFSDWELTQSIGTHKRYHDNGQLLLVKNHNGNSGLVGELRSYYDNGNKNFGGFYKNDKRDGVWDFYYRNGNKIASLVYEVGEIKTYSLWNEDGTEKKEKLIFEKRPKFKGGKNALANYVRKNLSPRFKKSKFKGRLILRFTINKEGRPEDILIHPENLSEKDKNSVLTFFREMPNWEPGIQLNRKVKVKYTLPIRVN